MNWIVLPIHIRPAVGTDLPLILNSWLESHREEGANAYMTNDVYYPLYHERFMSLLHGSVLVASNPHDDWQIHGWLAHSGRTIHYVYTKYAFRQMRVASRLFDAADRPEVATHTGSLFPILRERWGVQYDPRIAQ